ncbi:AAA family ATPase [Bradyrhizobium sp. JYMT SZCCT0180]|uniref:AAA family ATPase n=1 Tax=Bradyrhizobium sp. JYMT SZCCT0180 TaxID=2807666 RepID=UPI001BABFFE8|nr:AAA family ATPase [Bradyrhizobium sp. JYMT SZCCT0180]MBR1214628.1 AAA family ATPase [Bradyrhizobium sp. JYMT SZCCT0180]
MSRTDDADEIDLPEVGDAVSTGAAADSSDANERLKGLPRLLRYAMLITDKTDYLEQRLVAEIDELCPQLPHNATWAAAVGADTGLALAAELDHRAVVQNEPTLRSLADCVRLLCLPTPRDRTDFEDYRRVGKALVHGFHAIARHAEEHLCCDLERFVFGWAALPACTDMLSRGVSAAPNAVYLGRSMAEHRIVAAARAARRKLKEEEERKRLEEAEDAGEEAAEGPVQAAAAAEAVPDHHLVVVRLSSEAMKNTKLKDILGPLKGVINTPLPLVQVPPLQEVRSTLLFEFPYATDVIDFALADLVGRVTIHLRPLLLVGDPGGGKTRFARRLGEVLGLTVWRTDASRSDGAVFGGTDRRWYSAEPCHPFLAVAQGKTASPLILLDEIEKAPVRADYGRLWDCLLGFLESETNARYPDPALQANLDVSQVSYIATANSLDPLPSPIRDRFRVVRFPKPAASDLDALLPAVIADLAKERGLDASWVPSLDGAEHAAVARTWRGGSVRRLRRTVEAILRGRDLHATRN